jgi:hypothetical protein
MAVKRALTVQNVLDKKYKLFDFEDEWYDAFSNPERSGVWFIWGNSGNGKTSFVLKLIKCLAKFDRIIFNSLEEGATHTLQKSFLDLGMREVNGRLLVVQENPEKLLERLRAKRSPGIVIIDSFQYFGLSYKQYIDFKESLPGKLIVFISHAEGKLPASRAAQSVAYDATLKIWIEGYKAISKGRYLGPTGEYIIWPERAAIYWGEKKK